MLFQLSGMIAARALLLGIVLHFSCGIVDADALTLRKLTFDERNMDATDSFCPPYKQIVQLLEELTAASFGRVTLVDGDPSAEGRRIIMAIIKPYVVRHPKHPRQRHDRKSYWMEAGMEGNDCHVVTSLLAVVERLALHCKENCDGDYYIIPLINPDGYEYARETDAKWSKNRQPFAAVELSRTASTNNSRVNGDRPKTCYGIRLDFNYPPRETFRIGGSSDPCSEIYRGPRPAYAPEVKAVMKLKLAVPKLNFAITFMSTIAIHEQQLYDLLLYPYASSEKTIQESQQYIQLGRACSAAVKEYDYYPVYTSRFAKYWMHGGSSLDYWYFTQPSCYSYVWALERYANQTSTIGVRAKRVMAGINGMINRMNNGTLI